MLAFVLTTALAVSPTVAPADSANHDHFIPVQTVIEQSGDLRSVLAGFDSRESDSEMYTDRAHPTDNRK